MKEFKKGKINSFWHSPLTLVFLFCFLIIFAYNLIGLVEKERDTSEKKSLILDQIDSLKKRESMLNDDISKLNTDAGIEDVIREKYQVVKPGEKIVVIVDDKKDDISTQQTKSDHSFWNWVKRVFLIKN
jgi:cell division protein FtsB